MVLWDGKEVRAHPGPSVARVVFHDRRALLATLVHPESNFGDLYSAGRIDVRGDLVAALEAAYRSMMSRRNPGWGSRAWSRTRSLLQRNSLTRARENIHHHYDLGNDFYALWLDPPYMQYTCAYYPRAAMTLEEAQVAKMHHVCRKLRLRPGQRVVEAGCGWGGFARFMARHYGVTVQAYNVSREQIAYARRRAEEEGLAGRVEYVEEDYRAIRGSFDAFVSVGMLEHVGVPHYGELGRVIDRCLDDHGWGLIHTIGRHAPGTLNAWIRKRIFPGAHPPTLAEMAPIFEPADFTVLDVENLRLHYARTLEHWLERYESHRERVRSQFDDAFVRAWRLYLAGSIAGFRAGSLQLYQVVFTRAADAALPPSRAYLYEQDGSV
jgi:cyclopropane-fatty-acyl-phospholipid synthase